MAQLLTTLQTGKKYGMQTLEDHLNQLVMSRVISYEEALLRANNREAIHQPGGPVGAGVKG